MNNTMVRLNIGEMGDSPHEIIDSADLPWEGVLHRFVNAGGTPYSAIYYHGIEVKCTPREFEQQMLNQWKTSGKHISEIYGGTQ